MQDWIVERLNRRHDRAGFNSTEPALDKWIAETARGNEEKNLSRTYVLVRPGEVLVKGFYSLSACHVVTESLPLPHSKQLKLRCGIPAMRLGRLAVDVSFQKMNLGKFMLLQAFRRTQDAADICGCAVLTVDSMNDSAKRFYLKFGFIPHVDSEESLFFPVSWIRQLNLRPIIDPPVARSLEGHDYQI